MAIDPSISLQVRPAQMPDPMESVGRILTLRDLMRRGKLNDLQITEAQRQAEEQAAVREAVRGTGGDLRAALPAVTQASPTTGIELSRSLATLSSAELGNEKLKIENGLTRIKQIGSLAQGILSAPPEQRPQLYESARTQAATQGLLDQNTLSRLPATYNAQAEMALRNAAASAMTVSEQLTAAHQEIQRKLEEAKFTEQKRATGVAETGSAEARAEVLRHNQAMEGFTANEPGKRVPLPPAVFEQQKQLKMAGRETAGLTPFSGTYSGTSAGQGVTHNEEVLKSLPQGTADLVRGIVDGRVPLPTGAAMRSAYWQNLLGYAMAYEPGFDATQWRVRLDTRVDFAKGKAAQNIRSLNTLVDHLGKLTDSIKQLDNWGVPVGNMAANMVTEVFGGDRLKRIRKFETDYQAVVSEAVSVYKGTSATDQEIEHLRQKALTSTDSVAAQLASAKEIMNLAFGRLRALEDQYQNAFRRARDFRFLNDRSRAILKDKLGIDADAIDNPGGAPPPVSAPAGQGPAASAPTGQEPGKVSVVAPNGKTYFFVSQAAADAFKREAGIR